MQRKENSYTFDGKVNKYSWYGKQYWVSLKSKIRATIWSTNPTEYMSKGNEIIKSKRYLWVGGMDQVV
jgi:hypothetical protein